MVLLQLSTAFLGDVKHKNGKGMLVQNCALGGTICQQKTGKRIHPTPKEKHAVEGRDMYLKNWKY